MAKEKQGPTENKCSGCQFHETKRSGKAESNQIDNYCTHNSAPNSLRKLTPFHASNGAFTGYNDNTPDWCAFNIPKKKIKGRSILSTKA